jgi:hypothetical protein
MSGFVPISQTVSEGAFCELRVDGVSAKLDPTFSWWRHACCGEGDPAVAEAEVACH